jgi:hypothetical protein
MRDGICIVSDAIRVEIEPSESFGTSSRSQQVQEDIRLARDLV